MDDSPQTPKYAAPETAAVAAIVAIEPDAGRERGAFLRRVINLGIAPAAAIGAMAVVLLGVALAGYPPIHVLETWFRGAMGSRYAWAGTFSTACPLLLTGLAAGVAFKSGVLNIGAEGQFLVGAVAATALTTRYAPPIPPWLTIAIAILGGAAAGGLWGLGAGLLERFRGVPVVLSTILLNFVAKYVVDALLEGPLEAHGTSAPQSSQLAGHFWLPTMFGRSELHIGIVLAFVLAGVLFIMQRRTTYGFELLVTGLNPTAARIAGMPVHRRQLEVIAISGACAGLGGALEVLGVTHFMSASYGGYGYAGIAVALLGGLDPLGIAVAAVFFGMLDTGARYVEESSMALPHDLANVIKGLALLAILTAGAWTVSRRKQ